MCACGIFIKRLSKSVIKRWNPWKKTNFFFIWNQFQCCHWWLSFQTLYLVLTFIWEWKINDDGKRYKTVDNFVNVTYQHLNTNQKKRKRKIWSYPDKYCKNENIHASSVPRGDISKSKDLRISKSDSHFRSFEFFSLTKKNRISNV